MSEKKYFQINFIVFIFLAVLFNKPFLGFAGVIKKSSEDSVTKPSISLVKPSSSNSKIVDLRKGTQENQEQKDNSDAQPILAEVTKTKPAESKPEIPKKPSESNTNSNGAFKEKAIQQIRELTDELSEYTKEDVPFETLQKKVKDESEDYLIMRKDVLLITVWDNDDLKTETIVRPDGKISFPLIGDVQAEGLTLTQLDNIITERLKRYLRKPEVSVILKQIAGTKVSIMGEIKSPGVYRLEEEGRVLELAALAGGFTNDAVLKRVIIIRKDPDPSVILINLNRALLEADFSQNITLKQNDIVYISKKFIANVNYFLENVFGPLADSAITIQDLTGNR